MKNNKKLQELEKAGVKLPKIVVERKLKKEIIPWLQRDEIIVLTGARQTGKSVLLFQLILDCLLKKTNNIHYFNLDVEGHKNKLNNSEYLISLISKSKSKCYIIIDEIQRLKEPGLFLKGIYDLNMNVKFIVSGSSSIEIKSKVHETLAGRKKVFQLKPFDVEELIRLFYPDKSLKEILNNEIYLNKVITHFLIYGGYPKVAKEKNKKFKLELLDEIFKSYIEKDIKSLLNVENERAFINLVKLLSSQIGNLINKDELSGTLGIHKNTLDGYLFYLEQTFILDFLRPFYKNPRKELLKNPKVYFLDLGLRNYAINNFEGFDFRPDKGALFENFLYLLLKNKHPLNFWKTKAGAEVDFILLDGLIPVPYEVKASSLSDYKISKSLRSFIQTYNPKEAYCINLGKTGKIKIENSNVNFIKPKDLI